MGDTKFHCVYYHIRPTGEVFYVGKANSRRRPYTMARNAHHDSVVKKYGVDNIEVRITEVATEAEALALEIAEITRLRSDGVPLTNKTDGGEGVTGMVVSEATRAKISAFQRGKKRTPQAIAKTAAAKVGKKLTMEHRAKLSAAKRGKKWSDESRAKMSLTKKGVKLSKQHCESIRVGQIGRRHTDESKQKMVLAKTGKRASTATKEKMSASKRGVPWSEARRAADNARKLRRLETKLVELA